MQLSKFSFPTSICFGVGARRSVEEFAANHGIERPLLVTDEGLLRTDAYRLMTAQLDRVWPGAWECFSGVQPNPNEQDVEDAWEAYRGANCDSVIGLGGGSALDGAKALRLKVAFPDLTVTEVPLDKIAAPLVPMCAVPTTAGTGSEVGRSTVITSASLNRKVVLGNPALMPELAILDPELTAGLPPGLTAATGMDAMTHAIESFVCPIFHPMCDGIALEAIRMIREFLPRAVENGADLEARGQMLIAASMGAVAFQKDLGAAHSLAHPLSTHYGAHHGLANAIVLPHVIRFNGEEDTALYARIAETLQLDCGGDPAGRVADFLEDFLRTVGISQRLRDLGVPREELPALAAAAMQDGCHLTNPRRCTETDLLRLYEQAW